MTLVPNHAGVQYGYLLAEPAVKTHDRLVGEGDLRDQHDHLFSFLQHSLHQLHIDERFAASRHTADQAGEKALGNRGDRGCRNGIASHMSHDNGVQNVGNSPDEGGRKHGKRVAPEVF